MDEERFESLFDQVRELHRLADEITRSPRLRDNVRARLDLTGEIPSLPSDQRQVADDAVDALQAPRLSSAQARRLRKEFFGRR
jgi:hypothetical protein